MMRSKDDGAGVGGMGSAAVLEKPEPAGVPARKSYVNTYAASRVELEPKPVRAVPDPLDAKDGPVKGPRTGSACPL